jgi:cytochrome c oxidase assembly protein subunit 15
MRVVFDRHGLGTQLGIFHATVAQLFFLLICSIAFFTSNWWKNVPAQAIESAAAIRMRRWFLAATFLIFVQLILGATMRHQHAGLAIPDFPLAYGKVWPATDASSLHAYNAHRIETNGEQPITAGHIVVHMLHRVTACAVLLSIIACTVVAWRNTARGSLLRKFSALWLAVVLVQVVLGILTILSQRKVDVTTAHVALGAVTFLVGWLVVLAASRFVVAQTAKAPAAATILARGGQFEHA